MTTQQMDCLQPQQQPQQPHSRPQDVEIGLILVLEAVEGGIVLKRERSVGAMNHKLEWVLQ